MMELVEAKILANQVNRTISGKRVKNVITEQSPHRFAFFYGEPQNYKNLLEGRTVGKANAYGGQLEIEMEDSRLVFGDGVSLLYHEPNAKLPLKHQLLLEFTDGSALSGSVQMYGGLLCFPEDTFDNPYYIVAKEKPTPLSEAFNRLYYEDMLSIEGMEKLSAKAFLATEQRIPGLGNGVLQDILFHAAIHPKRKIKTLTENEKEHLFLSIKSTLAEMIEKGGRDTEKDLFGQYGKYQTKLSKKTLGTPCPRCKNIIQKEAYLGGSIYYCSECQA
jgi:formamidopyrimidine-DNA glycosylase